MKRSILVIDDEPDLIDLLSYNLKKEGFLVEGAPDGERALTMIRSNKYDLAILDLLLPGIQGLELCRLIRNDPDYFRLPLIMLTAKGEELDKVLGLEMGADDYLTKPFSIRELIARVKAILRRAEKEKAQQRLVLGPLTIDLESYTVDVSGQQVNLCSKEFKILVYLATRRGKVFTRNQILDAVWRDESFVEPRTVDVHIRRLRAQLEECPANPRFIKTLRGVGYFFAGDL